MRWGCLGARRGGNALLNSLKAARHAFEAARQAVDFAPLFFNGLAHRFNCLILMSDMDFKIIETGGKGGEGGHRLILIVDHALF